MNKGRKREKRIAMTGRWKAGGAVAALIAAMAVFITMLQIEKNMLTEYEKGVAYFAAVRIPKGEYITEENMDEYLREQEIDKSCIAESTICTKEQLKGSAALIDIESGVMLSRGMFEKMTDVLQGAEEPVIAGFKAEDLYQVVGGVLRAGDRIHIYSVSEEKQAKLIWSNLYVREVFDQTGTGIKNEDNTTAAQRINIYLDKADVEEFYSELAAGTLRVVKAVNRN